MMYDFISSIQNGHFLVPLTGPFRMKTAGVFALASLASRALPINKIITMIGDVEQKIIKEGEDAFEIRGESWSANRLRWTRSVV